MEIEATCKSTFKHAEGIGFWRGRDRWDAELITDDLIRVDIKNSPLPIECGKRYTVIIVEQFEDHGVHI